MKFRIILTSLVIFLGLGVYYVMTVQTNDPMSMVELIKENMDPKTGEIKDWHGDINYTGLESVGYEVLDDENIKIYFGDLQFTMKAEDFDNELLMAKMKEIGFEFVRSKKTGRVSVKYKGNYATHYGERETASD